MGSADFGKSKKYFTKFPGLQEAEYLYVDSGKGVDMVEFHIYYCKQLIYLLIVTNYGEFINVRFPEGQIPAMNIGHDECIFKQ